MAIFKDELFEAQWLRAAGHASYDAAEIGECLEIARQIGGADPERWFAAWSGFASRLFKAAELSEHAGHSASARGAYLRASNYWRAAWTFLFQAPIEARALDAYRRHREAFTRAAKLTSPAGEAIRIPYEGKFLHGYFFKGATNGAPLKTLIVNGGYDSTAEEAFLFSGAAALARGYNALGFDGPGQGAAIFEDGLVFRPDWEKVIGPVVDYLFTRPEVDQRRVALMGISFGGYLAPRAASFEPRLAALIADPGQLSLFEEMKRRLPPFAAGDSAAFAMAPDDPVIDPALIDYVSTFVPKNSGDRFSPHVTTGVALKADLDQMLAESFEGFSFSPAGVAVYQLGQFGTAAKKLKDLDVRP